MPGEQSPVRKTTTRSTWQWGSSLTCAENVEQQQAKPVFQLADGLLSRRECVERGFFAAEDLSEHSGTDSGSDLRMELDFEEFAAWRVNRMRVLFRVSEMPPL